MKRLLLLFLFSTAAALPAQRDPDHQPPERDLRRTEAPRQEPDGPRPMERSRGRRPAPPPWARRGESRQDRLPPPRRQHRPLPFERRGPGADGPERGRDFPGARRAEPGQRDEPGQRHRPDRAALRERLLRARLHRLQRRLHELERAGDRGRRDRARREPPAERA